MSAEETGKVPIALARRIARAVLRRVTGECDTAPSIEEAAGLIDREIAKAGAFIPAETLDQAIEAMEMTANTLEDLSPRGFAPSVAPSMWVRRVKAPLIAALSALRAAKSEGGPSK